MNLLHLKYAVEIADTGSINRAAENLYVSQPNLSRAIKELEASLGVVLFERSKKGNDAYSGRRDLCRILTRAAKTGRCR